MANKMLIDASHPEETRVVVLRGNRVEEFDFEAASKKQLRGNIYLAKVMRVEPSLQAAFVDYGGNRHGFLAFTEIHPDYYQIPVADRQALIEDEARVERDEDDDVSRSPRRSRRFRRDDRNGHRAEKRSSADSTLSGPYAGSDADDASKDTGDFAGAGETDGARQEPSEAGGAIGAPYLAAPEETDREDAAHENRHDLRAQPVFLAPEDASPVPSRPDHAAEFFPRGEARTQPWHREGRRHRFGTRARAFHHRDRLAGQE